MPCSSTLFEADLMRVLILGGDGYLGWPMAMNLSASSHEVHVVDNYLRRRLQDELKAPPLLEAPSLPERCKEWRQFSGFEIKASICDLTNRSSVFDLIRQINPEAIIHFAEQPSAPFSMKDAESAALTLHNNLSVTGHVLLAQKELCPDSHLIKLGTMGEYGTPNIDIEEGWLEVSHNGRTDTFLYPRQAGSLYHTTKIMDTDLIWFYVRAAQLRVTDLMQGPVYGLFTDETQKNDRLLTHFAYDEIFGTVLNRFFCQAVINHPLTIYGNGSQKRGFLDIRDTIASIQLVLRNPPERGELKILNQFVETFSINDLAARVTAVATELGLSPETTHLVNPRIEAEDHYYNPKNSSLISLGLSPHYLSDEFIADMLTWLLQHKEKISRSLIYQGVKW